MHKLKISKNGADAQPVIVCRQDFSLTHNSSISLNNAKAINAQVIERAVIFFAIDYSRYAKGNATFFRVIFKSEEEAASFLTIFNKHCECKCTFQGNVCEICCAKQATTPVKLEEAASNDENEYEAKPTTAKSVIDLGSDSEEDEETPSDADEDDEESKEVNDNSCSSVGSAASDEYFDLEDDFANSQAMPNIDDLTIINDL